MSRGAAPGAAGTPGLAAGAVLAAGAGRRFAGGIKQLASLDGEPLVRRACRIALDAGLDPVVLVLGAHADAVADAVSDLPVRPLFNARWDEGIASSIRAVALDAAATPAVAALAVVLADQPAVTAAHLRALWQRRAAAAAPIAATRSPGGVLGAPAVFARALFPALAALAGDRGARDLIAHHPGTVALPFAAAALDVDTPAALAALALSRASTQP